MSPAERNGHQDDIVSESFLGLDPGGDRGFGVALLHGVEVNATTVSSVSEAVSWAKAKCLWGPPVAAGIDAMLYWSDGRGGWRPADKLLRETYQVARSSVMSPNGLYGSMGIGGMAVAIRLRQYWPGLILNETHPKVLGYALRNEVHRDNDPVRAIEWFARHSGLKIAKETNGHEFDAMLSAWATREGLSRGWFDLVAEDPSLLFPAGPVRYLWPESIAPLETVKSLSQEPRGARPRRTDQRTTEIGYINRNNQIVVRRTDVAGTDHGQRVYVLRCVECGHEYGANGTDIFARKCPKHGGGAPGLIW